MAIRSPRTARIRRSVSVVSSPPSNRIEPVRVAPLGSSPMMARLVMDLPEPDSPTMPSVPPGATPKPMPSTTAVSPKRTVRSSTVSR